MSASIDTILTAIQQIVAAISTQTQNTNLLAGQTSACGITSPTLVKSGQGRLARLSVTVAGSQGTAYDTSLVSSAVNPLCVIPASVGVVEIMLPFGRGLLISPGSGQTVTVSYS